MTDFIVMDGIPGTKPSGRSEGVLKSDDRKQSEPRFGHERSIAINGVSAIVFPSGDISRTAFEARPNGWLTDPNILLKNQTLAALRDTLLPKLMSGELRVGEAREAGRGGRVTAVLYHRGGSRPRRPKSTGPALLR